MKNKPPYVCGGCEILSQCTLLKRIYDLDDANKMTHRIISESRTGIFLNRANRDDVARIKGITCPLVRNSQSLHQVYLNHVDDLIQKDIF